MSPFQPSASVVNCGLHLPVTLPNSFVTNSGDSPIPSKSNHTFEDQGMVSGTDCYVYKIAQPATCNATTDKSHF